MPVEYNLFDLDRIVRDTFVAQVLFEPELDSTNSTALEVCRRSDQRDTLLVLTSQQTAGRGRGANQWWSAAGALTFSVIVQAAPTRLPQVLWPRTSLTAGLAVCLALDELLPASKAKLKWPNDVLLEGHKVCGILVEVVPPASDTLVVGIGVNVNNSFAIAPEDLKRVATSLFDVTNHEFNLTDVLIGILREFEAGLTRLACGDPQLATDWQSRCALHGRTVEIDTGSRRMSGVCQGIDGEGALVLLTEQGPVQTFGGVVASIS